MVRRAFWLTRCLLLTLAWDRCASRTGLVDHLEACELAQDPRTLAELGDHFKASKFGWLRIPGHGAPDAYRGKVMSHTDYAYFYAPYFEEYRSKRFRLLELGIDTGASLKVWRTYFPCAEIHGVDLVPVAVDGAEIHFGNLSDASWYDDWGLGHFDVIVDDASHAVSDQLLAFERLFGVALSPGGVYVVEDLETSF